ncbi:MAG: AAA family ATPase [Clostridia bacterium]|nr:AAA family ATPase [Clostridia bacterium]
MIIKKIEVGGFGKLSNTTYLPQNGFNLVFGGNEQGKTTLMSFVKMMFYSSSSKSEKAADIFKSLRKKYRPFSGSPMSGAIEFEIDGLEYRIQKEFLKSDISDKTVIFCKTTGEELDIKNKNEAGEYFFKMTLDEFEKSIFIGAFGGFSADSNADSLAMRISNLSVSGDESISHEQILKRLSDAAEELVSKSRKKGILVEAENKLEELKSEKERLLGLEKSQKILQEEISVLEKEIASLEKDFNDLSNAEKTESAAKELNIYYALRNKLNLLSTVKKQLADYSLPLDTLRKFAVQAKLLNTDIENTLSNMQEATVAAANALIPDEEYHRLDSLDKKSSKLNQDLLHLREKITPLYEELLLKTKSAVRKSVFSSFAVFAAFLALAAFLLLSKQPFNYAGWGVLGLGTVIFGVMLLCAKKSATSKFTVQLAKRDLEAEIKQLSSFSEDMLDKNPSQLTLQISSLLESNNKQLAEGIASNGCQNIDALRKSSAAAHSEDIKELSEILESQKESFTSLVSTIKPVSTFSAAKILYVELAESLNSLESITVEIDSICNLADISDTSDDFIAAQIKHLTDLAGKALAKNLDSNLSTDELSLKLREKRAALNEKIKLIHHPERTHSQIKQDIAAADARVKQLSSRLKEINIAREIMDEAILDANKGLGSQLSKRVGDYLNELSGGKYTDVLVPRDLNIETRLESGAPYHEWKYLSGGAIDRTYLALRLAITDIIAKNNQPLPLFFDDILTQYDDDACKNALLFLKKYLEGSGSVSQIMFFTCHSHIAEAVKNIFSDVNEILL